MDKKVEKAFEECNKIIETLTPAEIDKVLDSLPFKEPICNSCIHMKSGKYETQCLNCIHGELVFEDNYSQTKINKE